MWGYTIAIAAALVFYVWGIEWYQEWHYARQCAARGCAPPVQLRSGPLGIRSIWWTVKAARNYRMVEEVSNVFKTHGDVRTMRFKVFHKTTMSTCDPENIKALLSTHDKDYNVFFRLKKMGVVTGAGVFTLSGEPWHVSRALLRPHFTKEAISHVNHLERSMQKLLGILRKHGEKKEPVDVQNLFSSYTLDTSSDYLFGESANTLGGGSKEFADAFEVAQAWIVTRFLAQALYPLIDGPSFRKAIRQCKSFFEYYVSRELSGESKNDEDKRYFFLRELSKKTQDPLVLRDQAFNVFVAARDTTAALMSFLVALLLRHPRVWNKLREEVLDRFGTDVDRVTYEKINSFTYMKHVINEAQRVYPVVPTNTRAATRDTELPTGGGPDGTLPVLVPKDTIVQWNVYALHRDPRIWGDDAAEFRPERWEQEGIPHRWTFLPFGGGHRVCLGMNLAMVETAYVLVRLMQTFSSVHGDKSPIRQKRQVVVTIAGGVPVWFE